MQRLNILFCVLFVLIQTNQALNTITLKPVFSEENRSKFLKNLRLLQIDNSKPASFLQTLTKEKQITLHQQVIAQKRLATYYGEIGVGIGVGSNQSKTQMFKMLFDTGSCEFWIPSDQCSTSRCMTHTRYSKSNTYSIYQGSGMSIQYLSGKVQGDMAHESIVLGDMTVPKQVIGIAREVDIPLLDEVIWDGILGLAYANQNLKNQGIKPLFDNIMQQGILTNKGELNQFAYYLGPELGAISFGGADMKYKRSLDEEFVWTPVTEQNYWTINLSNIRKIPRSQVENGQDNGVTNRLCPNGCKAIVDTGTYLIYGPEDQINDLLSDMTLDDCSQKKDLPNVVFEFIGEDNNGQREYIEVTMTPEDYVLHFKIDGQDDCVIGIVPDNVDTGYTIGQVFLKAFYTVFDRDNNRVGFVRANPHPGIYEHANNKLKSKPTKVTSLNLDTEYSNGPIEQNNSPTARSETELEKSIDSIFEGTSEPTINNDFYGTDSSMDVYGAMLPN